MRSSLFTLIRVSPLLFLALAPLACSTPTSTAPPPAQAAPSPAFTLPPGFAIAPWATGVPNARSMVRGERGTLFVGTRNDGNVYAVLDADGDPSRADRVITLASGLNMPNGVAFRDGSLYVAEVHRILRFDDIEARLDNPPEPVVVFSDLPDERAHGWKFIAFGPDGRLYIPIGAPCNLCERPDPYASIARIQPDGTGFEIVARGVRNSVGFAWHPATQELWFTDNGRDNLGDDTPPDELNRVTAPGQHFGYPYCHGGDISDPELGSKRPCADTAPPVQRLGPHVAALGLEFYDGAMFPDTWRRQAFIAEHGSWNRTTPIGYRVSVVHLDAQQRALSYTPFITGWRDPATGTVHGRPVDLLTLPDGSLLVSDDHAGVIWRVTYTPPS